VKNVAIAGKERSPGLVGQKGTRRIALALSCLIGAMHFGME
jgi:hypothetical protein